MMPRKSRHPIAGLGFLVVLSLLLALSGCGDGDDASQAGTIKVSMLIQVDENNARWFRDVEVPKGTDGYELTEKVTEGDLKSTYYASFRSHFVEGLLGTDNSGSKYWIASVWSESQSNWEPLPVGADLYSLKEGHVLAWYYSGQEGSVPPATP